MVKKKDLGNSLLSEIGSYEILKNNPIATAIIDPDTSIRYINPAFEKLFGYRLSELIGKKPPYPYWLPEKIDDTKKLLKAAMKKGVKKFETRLMKKNGKTIWVEANSVPVMKKGRLKYYLSNLIDITSRKEAEAGLTKAYSELDMVFNTAEDGMRIVDADFNVLRVNRKFCSISGLSRKENLKRKCYESFPGEHCHGSSCSLKQVLNGGKRIEIESIKVTSGGKKIPCSLTATPLKTNNGTINRAGGAVIKGYNTNTETTAYAQILAKSNGLEMSMINTLF